MTDLERLQDMASSTVRYTYHEDDGTPNRYVKLGEEQFDWLCDRLRELLNDRSWKYPHMCRDEHPEIGHKTDEELCPVCLERGRADQAEAALESARHNEDLFWDYLLDGYEIEPRSYFEEKYPEKPLYMAAHYIWKRDPKVAAERERAAKSLEAADKMRRATHRMVDYWNGDRCGYCEAPLNPDDDSVVWNADHTQGCLVRGAIQAMAEFRAIRGKGEGNG